MYFIEEIYQHFNWTRGTDKKGVISILKQIFEARVFHFEYILFTFSAFDFHHIKIEMKKRGGKITLSWRWSYCKVEKWHF